MPAPLTPRRPLPRKNVSQACKACRARKSRCDGQQPSCGRCTISDLECDYSSRIDGRSRGTEVSVARRSDSGTRTLVSVASRDDGTAGHGNDTSGSPSTYRASDSLQYDGTTGSLTFLGPTSIPQGSADPPSYIAGSSWTPTPRFSADSANPGAELGQNLHDELLDQYFTFLNGFCAFVDEKAFRDGLTVWSTGLAEESAGYSPFLHHTILASAAHISSRADLAPFNGTGSLAGAKGLTFTQRAVAMLDTEIERPQPTTIQGLTLLIMMLADCGKNQFAWVYCGIAARLSEALGLHIDSRGLSQSGVISSTALETRQHAYWSLHAQDKLIALYLGRRSHVDESDSDVPLPTRSATSIGSPCLEEYEQAIVTLCTIWSQEHRYLYGLRHQRRGTSRQSEEDLKRLLQHWKTKLPPALLSPEIQRSAAPVVYVIHSLHNTFTILLHRIHLRDRALESTDGMICLEAASSTMRLARTYDITYGIRKAPVTMTQNMFVASSVLILILADSYDQPSYVDCISKAQNALDELDRLLDQFSTSWALAGHALSRLRALRIADEVNSLAPAPLEPDLDFSMLDELFSFPDLTMF